MSEVIKGKLIDIADVIYAQLQSGQTITFVVRGTSMFPLFIDGKTEVTLRKATVYKKGDIIFYNRADSSFVLHRIVRQEKDGTFTLCGDNQTALEHGVTAEKILAKVESYSVKNKSRKVSDARFKFYSFWWRAFLPVRGQLLRVIRRLKKAR